MTAFAATPAFEAWPVLSNCAIFLQLFDARCVY